LGENSVGIERDRRDELVERGLIEKLRLRFSRLRLGRIGGAQGLGNARQSERQDANQHTHRTNPVRREGARSSWPARRRMRTGEGPAPDIVVETRDFCR
jgi:hypothetical protein